MCLCVAVVPLLIVGLLLGDCLRFCLLIGWILPVTCVFWVGLGVLGCWFGCSYAG